MEIPPTQRMLCERSDDLFVRGAAVLLAPRCAGSCFVCCVYAHIKVISR